MTDSPIIITKPTQKTQKRTNTPKEYYLLREDVFEFIGIFKASSLPILTLIQEPADVCGV